MCSYLREFVKLTSSWPPARVEGRSELHSLPPLNSDDFHVFRTWLVSQVTLLLREKTPLRGMLQPSHHTLKKKGSFFRKKTPREGADSPRSILLRKKGHFSPKSSYILPKITYFYVKNNKMYIKNAGV